MDAPPVQYVTSADGWSIAYTVTGEGQPLVVWSGGFDSANYAARFHAEWLAGLAAHFRVIYVDVRGSGLSQRGLKPDLSLADFDRDVEAVAERFSGQRLIFFARGMMGHPVIRFSARHPDRVRAIVWVAANMRGDEWPFVRFAAFSPENWRVFLDTMASHYATSAERRELAEEYARNVELDDLKIAVDVTTPSSVEAELAGLTAPLLVLHPRDYLTLPPASSMRVASHAPNARLVLLDGAAAFDLQEIMAVNDFLASLPPEVREPPLRDLDERLSSREVEVLRLLAAGKSNQQIADELVISVNTANRHVSNIYAKTGAANRAEAATYAARHGIA